MTDPTKPEGGKPEPPYPIGAGNNCKRAGWTAFFDGKPRSPHPFPPGRLDLKAGYEEGWNAAKDTARARSLVTR